jgi:hypothetical protein
MKKAIFGITAILALTTTPALASDGKRDGKIPGDSRASGQTRSMAEDATLAAGERGEVKVARAETTATSSSAAGSSMRSIDVNASHAERWLVEREGYRDGGY